MDEIAADDFVLGGFKDAFEVGLAGLFHGSGDFLVAGVFRGFDGEVNHGNGGHRDAERHAGELALHFGADEPDGPGRAGGAGDDVLGRGAPALPVFFAGAVHGFLRGGIGMHRGHQTFLDAKAFLEEDMHEGREAVGSAGGVGYDVVLGRVVFLVVDAHDDGNVLTLGRGADDDFLGTGGDMALGLFRVGEEAGGFDDDVHAQLLPREAGGVLGADDEDVVAVNDQDVVLSLVGRGFLGGNLAVEASLGGIIFEQVGEIIGGDDVADRDDLEVLAQQTLFGDGAKHQTANAPEPINCNFNCHSYVDFNYSSFQN